MINDVGFCGGKVGVGAGHGRVTWAPPPPLPTLHPCPEERVLPPQLSGALGRERVIGSAWRSAGLCPHHRKEFGGRPAVGDHVADSPRTPPTQTCSQLAASFDQILPLPLRSPACLSFSKRTGRAVPWRREKGGLQRPLAGLDGKGWEMLSTSLRTHRPRRQAPGFMGPTLPQLDASRRAGHLDSRKSQADLWAEAGFSSGAVSHQQKPRCYF